MHTYTHKSHIKDLSDYKRKSLFHSSLQPESFWPAGQLNSPLFNDPVHSYHLWIRGILQDLAREGVQDSWSNPIWWTHSPFSVSPSPAKPLSTCKTPLGFSGISHWLNAEHMAAFIAPPPWLLACPRPGKQLTHSTQQQLSTLKKDSCIQRRGDPSAQEKPNC